MTKTIENILKKYNVYSKDLEIDLLYHLMEKCRDHWMWQPIERAPKDGTEILVCDSEYGNISLCIFNAYRNYWEACNEFECKGITHWMPLPNPPISTIEE